MLGFGSPDDLVIDDVYDYGFGDPSPSVPITVIDWGFGDVPTLPPEFIVADDAGLYPDDGGEIIVLRGEWPIVGPYHVQLLQSATGQEFPDSGTAPGTYAPVMLTGLGKARKRGSPYWCYTGIKPKAPGVDPSTTVSDGNLSFVLPHVPCGTYDIKVSWGASLYPPPEDSDDPDVLSHVFTTDTTLAEALRVIYRNRSREQWRVRSAFPEHYTVGAKGERLETLLEGSGA